MEHEEIGERDRKRQRDGREEIGVACMQLFVRQDGDPRYDAGGDINHFIIATM